MYFTGDMIKLIGGALCLDFVNTVHDRVKTPSEDYLKDGYVSLLQWAKLAGALPEKLSTELNARSKTEPRKSVATHKQALQLRELLYSMFSGDRPVSTADLSLFNRFLSDSLRQKAIQKGLVDGWVSSGYSFDRVWWPIVESAYHLILDQPKIKQCPACHWLFVDQSKAGRRVWCSMDTCGAIDKARRYYQKKKHDSKNVARKGA